MTVWRAASAPYVATDRKKAKNDGKKPDGFKRRLGCLFFGLTSNIPKQSNYVSSVPADTKKTLHHGALLAFLPILQRVSRTNPLAESLI